VVIVPFHHGRNRHIGGGVLALIWLLLLLLLLLRIAVRLGLGGGLTVRKGVALPHRGGRSGRSNVAAM
jgi:hypothetical protein